MIPCQPITSTVRSLTISLSALFLGLTGTMLVPPSRAEIGTAIVAQTLTNSQKQEIVQKAEEYLTLISNKDYAKARTLLSPELQKDWTAEKIGQLWQSQFIDVAGSYQKILDKEVIDVVNADIVKLTVQLSNGTEDILLTFNKQQQLIAANWTAGKSITQVVEEFIGALGEEDYAKARTYLSPLLKAEIFPQRIQKGWSRVIDKNGKFRRLVDVEVKPSPFLNSPDLAIAILKFANGPQQVFIFFDKDQFITNIDLPED